MMMIPPRDTNAFVETSAALMVEAAFDDAAAPGAYPSFIQGDPGTGKSTALMHYAEERDAIYCLALSGTKTARGLFELVAQSAGWASRSTFYRDLAKFIDDRLDSWGQATGRTIVIDDVQHVGLEGLIDLMKMADHHRCPMVLAGNDKRLARTRSHNFELGQITSRIGTRVPLDTHPLPEDCLLILDAQGVTDKAALKALAAYGSHTNFRELDKVVQRARHAAEGAPPVFRHVEYAVRRLHGGDNKSMKLLEAA
jgi:DNA transposition AAA+ family ATPase